MPGRIRFRSVRGASPAPGYSLEEVRNFAATAVRFAGKKIASEITNNCYVGDETNPYEDFDLSFLSNTERILLYYLNINPLIPRPINEYDGIVGNAIKNSQEVINEVIDGRQLGVDPEVLDDIHFNYVKPFLEISPITGGSAKLINSLIEDLDNVLAKSCGSQRIVRSFRDLLLVLKEGKINYIAYLTQVRKSQEIHNTLKRFAYKVHCLEEVLQEIVSGGGILDGKVNLKIQKPKPALYALAIFDLYNAWYRFLYPNCKVDRDKLLPIVDYVRDLGSEESGREELYKILDIVYADPLEDEAIENANPDDNPYRKWLPRQEIVNNGIIVPPNPDYLLTAQEYGKSSSDEADGYETVYNDVLTYVKGGALHGSLVLAGELCLRTAPLPPASFCLKPRAKSLTKKKRVRCRTTFKCKC